jgi:hypothetical protein
MRGKRHARQQISLSKPAASKAKPAQKIESGTSGQSGKNENADVMGQIPPIVSVASASPWRRARLIKHDPKHDPMRRLNRNPV